jgi:uncharacterized protein
MPTVAQARAWYPQNDPIHGFDHVLRVLRLAEHLAQAEGADLEIVRAAVLLHDAGLDLPLDSVVQPLPPESSEGGAQHSARANHQHASADFASRVLRAEGWPEDRIAAVVHCIRAHRFRDDSEQPQTLEAKVLFDADKLDAIGAIGVGRAIAFAARAGQPPYAPPSEHFRLHGQTLPGEPHSAYHEYLFKLSKLAGRLFTPSARQIGAARHRFMTAFFERLAEEAEV